MRGGFNQEMTKVANVARVSRIALVRRLEKEYPSMVVCTRPFLIEHADLGKRAREIKACTLVKEEFFAAKIEVKVVRTSAGAYVLRSTEGIKNHALVEKEEIKALTGKRRHCWGGKGDANA